MAYIDKVQLDDTLVVARVEPTLYGRCSTAENIVAKEVNIPDFELITGVTIHVKFVYANSVSDPTLNVSETGAKPLLLNTNEHIGSNANTTGWKAGAVVAFTYDGTGWVRDQGYNTNDNTHYSTRLFSGRGTSAQNTTVSAATNSVKLIAVDYDSNTGISTINPNAITLVGGGTTKVSSANGIVTITSTGVDSSSVIGEFDDSELLKLDGSRTMEGTLVLQGIQYADAYSGALNANDSNIFNVHSIFTSSVGNNALNGIHFYRSSSRVDTLWVNNGDILFAPNRALGSQVIKDESQKVGRFTINPSSNSIVVSDGTTGGLRTALPSELYNILHLSSPLKFIGITTSDLSDDSQVGTIMIDGIAVSANAGDVVINATQSEEFLWTGSHWELLGPDSSFRALLNEPYDSGSTVTPTTINTANTWISRIQQNINGAVSVSFSTLDTSGLWSGTSTRSYSLVSRGEQVQESQTTVPDLTGLSMSEANNNGWPSQYGNILTLSGRGHSQIFMGYSASSVEHRNFFIRNKAADIDTPWSNWSTIVDSDNVGDFAALPNGTNASGLWPIIAEYATYDNEEYSSVNNENVQRIPISQKYSRVDHGHGLINNNGTIGFSEGAVYTDNTGLIRSTSFYNNDQAEYIGTGTTFVGGIIQNANGQVRFSKLALNTTGTWQGLAITAQTLEHERELYVNLSVERDPVLNHVVFDGSADVELQVTGVLPIEHGGTNVTALTANRLIYIKEIMTTDLQGNISVESYFDDGLLERESGDYNDYGHYIDNTKLAINSTETPTYTLLVNGHSEYVGNLYINTYLDSLDNEIGTNIIFLGMNQDLGARGFAWNSNTGYTGQMFYQIGDGEDSMYMNIIQPDISNHSAKLSFRIQNSELLAIEKQGSLQNPLTWITAKTNIRVLNDTLSLSRGYSTVNPYTTTAIRMQKNRDIALVKITQYNNYDTIWSMKTAYGNWGQGVLEDNLYWTYITDTNYASQNTNIDWNMILHSTGVLEVPTFHALNNVTIYHSLANNTDSYKWNLSIGTSGNNQCGLIQLKDGSDQILQTIQGMSDYIQVQTLRAIEELQVHAPQTMDASRLRLVYGGYGAIWENNSFISQDLSGNPYAGGCQMRVRFTNAAEPYETPNDVIPMVIFQEGATVDFRNNAVVYNQEGDATAKLWINTFPLNANRSYGDYLEIVGNYTSDDGWPVSLTNVTTSQRAGYGIGLRLVNDNSNSGRWAGIRSRTMETVTYIGLDFYSTGGAAMRLMRQDNDVGYLIPTTTNAYDLGSSTYRWRSLHIGTSNQYGSGTQPIYWLNGVPTASSSTVGATNKPVYLNNGTITALSDTVGGGEQPIYSNAGVLTATTYALKATVNNGTANRIAYYSGARAISAANASGSALITDGGNIEAQHTHSDGNAYIRLTANSKTIGLHVGSGGTNRGVYDFTRAEWLCYSTNSDAFFIGRADRATKLETARSLWGNNFDGTGGISGTITLSNGADIHFNPTSANDTGDIVWYYANGNEKMRIWANDTYSSKSGPNFRVYNSSGTSLYSGTLVPSDGTGASGTWSINITGNAGGSSTSCSGNAATATQLQTSRSLWGNSFNGTGDISGTILIPTTASAAATSQPTALSYGRLQAYGTLCINANTDNSGTEYVILTAGKGVSSSGSDGLEVGSSTLKFLGTDVVRNSGTWGISITGSAGSVAWANTGHPSTFPPSSHSHSWSDITSGVPSTFTPAAHTHSWTEITDKPSTFTPSSHSHLWSDISDKPSTFTPSSHSHAWTEITDKPSTFTPTAHSHSWSDISDRGSCTINTSGTITGSKVYGAVWNDFAEYRHIDTIEAGYVVYEIGGGCMSKSTERLQPGCKITSDTFGMCMGKTDKAQTPIAIAGRVLVYPYRNREEYELGAAVCSAPGGTVDIMTREEIIKYPERIIGTVSEIPTYEVWSAGNGEENNKISVNNRIWVYVR